MIFGPRRAHFLAIFDKVFRDFGLLILLLIFCFFTRKWNLLFDNIGILVAVSIVPLSRLFSFFFTYYSIDDEKLYVKKGFLNKKNIEIPLEKITNIDTSQGLIFQLAGVFSINVDTGATINTENLSKINIALKREDAIFCKSLLLRKAPSPEKTILTKKDAAIKDLLIMAVMQSRMVLLAQIVSFTFLIFTYIDTADTFVLNYLLKINSISLVFISMVVLYTLLLIIAVISAFIRYYNFCVENLGESLSIRYGLLTRKNHTILKEKISGVNFKQSFLMKLFGYGRLEVFAIGYDINDEKTLVSILFPLLKVSDLKEFMDTYIPGLHMEANQIMPPGKSLKYFFLCPRMFFNAILAIACFATYAFNTITSPYIDRFLVLLPVFGGLFLIGAIISIILEFKNTSISYTDATIALTSGGFTKNNIFLKTAMTESIKESASIFKRRKGIVSFSFGIWAHTQHSIHNVRNLPEEVFRQISQILLR